PTMASPSTTVTGTSRFTSSNAAVRPAGPAPITTTCGLSATIRLRPSLSVPRPELTDRGRRLVHTRRLTLGHVRGTTLARASRRPSPVSIVPDMRATSSSDAPAPMIMISDWPAALLLAGWVAVALGIGTHDGRYALPSLALVVIGTVLVAAGVLRAGSRSGLLAQLPVAPAWAGRLTLAAAALTVGLAPLIWHPRYFA